jgi:ABC-type nitrate/sulfonate/bicarbonate transport system ATPase subunit
MERNNGALIELSGLRKVFHTEELETHALADIDLEIGEGEYVSVAGPSGCGKSTLLSILGLLDTPTAWPGTRWRSSPVPNGPISGISKSASSSRPST